MRAPWLRCLGSLEHGRAAEAQWKAASASWRPGIRKSRSAFLTLPMTIHVRQVWYLACMWRVLGRKENHVFLIAERFESPPKRSTSDPLEFLRLPLSTPAVAPGTKVKQVRLLAKCFQFSPIKQCRRTWIAPLYDKRCGL